MARREVWDYQPEEGETQAPWAAFTAFRDGPKPRVLAQLAPTLGYAYDTLLTWSKDFCWFDRAAAYDRHLDKKAQRAAENAVQRMTRRHLDLASLLRRKAASEARRLLKDQNEFLSPRDIIRMAEIAVKLERLGNGEATERTEHVGDLGRLSDAEAKMAEELARKARGE